MGNGKPPPSELVFSLRIIASILIAFASSLTLGVGNLRVWAPLPIHMFLLIIVTGGLGVILPGVGFLVFTRSLARRDMKLPLVWIAVFVALAILDCWYYVTSCSSGYREQGVSYTETVGLGNLAFILALGGLSVIARLRTGLAVRFTFHFLFFLWLGWYAFPYFGVLP